MKTRVFCMLLALTMVLSITPLTAISALAVDYPSLQLGEEVLIELEPNVSMWYQFAPEETQYYQVTSSNPDVVDPICKVYNSEMNLIAENDDEEGSNFKCMLELTAGETYYFEFLEFDSNNEGSYTVTLSYAMPTDLWMDEYAITSYTGNAFALGFGTYPYDVPVNLTWTSSDNSVATVDENGWVTCVGVGDTAITVAVGGLSDTCHITVKDGGVPIYLDDVKTVTFIPKENRETAQAFCFVPEESGTYRMYSYNIVSTTEEAVDPRIWVRDAFENEIAYDDDGGEAENSDVQCRLEAGKPYYFEVEPYDCKAAGQVTVTLVKCVAAESISIDGSDFTAVEGESMDIYVTLSPENCAEEDYTVTSSDTSVVRIDDKTAYFVGGGEATITVTSEYGLTDSITVTVQGLTEISADTTYTLNCLASEYKGYEKYKFIPTESGVYRFESFNIVGDWDPRIALYGKSEYLRYSYDKGEDLNFMLDYELIAGEIYYIEVAADGYEPIENGTVDFKVSKLDESEFPALESNSTTDVIVDVAGLNKYFRFTPVHSGIYAFFSTREDDSEIDPKMQIFDDKWECIGSDDDSNGDGNYYYTGILHAGKTYYIKSFIYSNDDIGTYTLNIEMLGATTVETTAVEDTEFTGDEVKTLITKFITQNADIIEAPVLFRVDGSQRTVYKTLSYGSEYSVSYEFSAADFDDGVYTKTFAFGARINEEWYYGNEFTVSYICPCSVTFDANGGEGAIESATVMCGEEYTLPENSFTAPAGMEFKAWSIDGVEKAAGDVIEISGNTTIIAVWKDIIGDIDGNYDVNSTDYILLKRAYLNTYALNEAQERRADINKDDDINATDYVLLKRFCFGTYSIG